MLVRRVLKGIIFVGGSRTRLYPSKDEGISVDLIKHVEDRLGHDSRYGVDPTRIKNDIGWYSETPFEW